MQIGVGFNEWLPWEGRYARAGIESGQSCGNFGQGVCCDFRQLNDGSNMAEAPRKIVGVLYKGALSLDLLGPLEAFNFAKMELMARGVVSYETVLVGPAKGPIETLSGIKMVAEEDFSDCTDFDTVILPGALTNDFRYCDDGVVDWLRISAPKIRRIASICSGAHICGDAGLLDGERVTTHWMDGGVLKERYPLATVEPEKIFLKSGNLYSSGGVTAGIDLALALIEEDFDRELALTVARRMVVFLKRQGDQSQFSDILQAQSNATRFSKVLDWIEEHISGEMSVGDLAQQCSMSERNFSRRFREEFSVAPMKYVSKRRLYRAKLLMEETQLPLKSIAARCGFKSRSQMERLFKTELHVTPSNYRLRFGRVGAEDGPSN